MCHLSVGSTLGRDSYPFKGSWGSLRIPGTEPQSQQGHYAIFQDGGPEVLGMNQFSSSSIHSDPASIRCCRNQVRHVERHTVMKLKSTTWEDATVICGDQWPHRSDIPSVDARPETQVTPHPTSTHHCVPQHFVSSPEVGVRERDRETPRTLILLFSPVQR